MLKLTGKHFLLILLYAPVDEKLNYPISGRTRLMKMGFIFDKEYRKNFEKNKNIEIVFPSYEAWKYGPFSKELLGDLEFLRNQGYIEGKRGVDTPIQEELEEYEYWTDEYDEETPMEYEQEDFFLSKDKGMSRAKDIWDKLKDNQKEILIDFKTELVKLPLRRILEHVYKTYKNEGYIDKSLISERFI